jgi:hypothetical protein
MNDQWEHPPKESHSWEYTTFYIEPLTSYSCHIKLTYLYDDSPISKGDKSHYEVYTLFPSDFIAYGYSLNHPANLGIIVSFANTSRVYFLFLQVFSLGLLACNQLYQQVK